MSSKSLLPKTWIAICILLYANTLFSQNLPPTVSLLWPTSGLAFLPNTPIALSANANDPDGSIVRVEFYRDANILIGTATTEPYIIEWEGAMPNTYRLFAKAIDNQGASTISNPARITVRELQNPTIIATLTAPANNAVLDAPANIPFAVDAYSLYGSTIAKVEFYSDETLLNTDMTAPFGFTLANVPPGEYHFNMRAIDNNGIVSLLDTRTVTVVLPNVPIRSVFNFPANNATFPFGQPVDVGISAAATDGIRTVKFCLDDVFVGEDASFPYTFSFRNLSVGNHNLKAVVVDNLGGMGTAVIRVVIQTNNQLPLITSILPANNAEYTAPANVLFRINTNDIDGTIQSVKICNGDIVIGNAEFNTITQNYAYTWANVPSGIYNLTIKVTDNQGGVTMNPLTVKVNAVIVPTNVPPSVIITSPTNLQVFMLTPNVQLNVPMQITATDIDGTIATVEVSSIVNNTTTFLGLATLVNGQYQFTLAVHSLGFYTIAVKATDNQGAMTTRTVTFEVRAATPIPNVLPVVSITSPLNNSIFTLQAGATTLTIPLVVSATDADGTVTTIQLFDGNTLFGTATAIPTETVYNFNLDNRGVGNYAFSAKVTDNNGGMATSNVVNVQVVPFVVPNNLPTVRLTRPTQGEIFSDVSATMIQLEAIATDLDGITNLDRVEFYRRTAGTLIDILIGIDNTPFATNPAPLVVGGTTAIFSVVWDNAPNGVYELVARVYDKQGATAISQRVTITVNVITSGLIVNQSETTTQKLDKNGQNTEGVTKINSETASHINKQASTLYIAPNPASDYITLNTVIPQTDTYQLFVTDITGKQCIVQQLNIEKGAFQKTLPIFTLPRGLYIVKLTDGKKYSVASKLLVD